VVAALALLGLLALAACGGRGRGAAHPHQRVACVGCHRGGPTPFGRAGVPDDACSSRGCHPDGGPDTARIAMVRFRHSAHPMSEKRSVPCAACHTHAPGSTDLVADSTTCALCHFTEIASTRDSGCATCHPHPRHVQTTSQGVPLPHAMLQQARIPCTRCHYRVVEGDTTSRAAPPATRPIRPPSSRRRTRSTPVIPSSRAAPATAGSSTGWSP
jgi:hypothetical protein